MAFLAVIELHKNGFTSDTNIREAVCDFLNGQSCSVVCYGQTASGKTYTMFGPPELTAFNTTKSYAGIAPR